MDLDVQTTDFTTMLPRRSSPGFRRTKVVEHFRAITATPHYCPIRHADWQPLYPPYAAKALQSFIDFPDRL